jgi:hypothetical protein
MYARLGIFGRGSVIFGIFSLKPAVGACWACLSPVGVVGAQAVFMGCTFEPTTLVGSLPG